MVSIKNLLPAAIVAAIAFMPNAAHASTFTWDFASSPGNDFETNTQTFNDTQSKYTITARGYSLGSATSLTPGVGKTWNTQYTANYDLFGKYSGGNLGKDETGLGLANNDDYEIDSNSFIQLDFSSLPTTTQYVDLVISSIQKGETATIWGSNSVGTPGAFLTELKNTNGSTSETIQTYQYDLSKGRYLSVSTDPSAHGGNDILIQSGLTAEIPIHSVPEPSSEIGLLVFSSFVSTGLMLKRSRKTN